MSDKCKLLSAIVLVLGTAGGLSAAEPSELAKALRELSPDVFSGDEQAAARRMLNIDLRSRIQKANNASRQAWLKIDTREQWQDFRADRVSALKRSLGNWPTPPAEIRKIVAGTIKGDGFVIENIVYESRPGWWVTANLYRPAKPPAKMPGIIISHSHHRPKQQGELQDMGMTWARAGCLVLVPDHLGHGERAQHGLKSADDFPRDFAVSRQDYYFRYDNSIQLYLAGESLMGWMAWDLMRGVDVLLSQDRIDNEKIILLGAVAGGGDPCAVTAALDERITCAVPFNFGGPQPETRYPLPEDAETSFNYAGSGSWESTRNLADSATSNWPFLPWEIVSSIAPRRLIYAHEFNWHRERDPVWNRLEQVYELYDAEGNLAFTHGRGEVRGSSDAATHCTHIGKFHRVKIHAAFDTWFGIHADEYSNPVESSKLRAAPALERADVKNVPLSELLAADTEKALKASRSTISNRDANTRRDDLRAKLTRALGDVGADARTPWVVKQRKTETLEFGDHTFNVERLYTRRKLGVENDSTETTFLLLLPQTNEVPKPLVVLLAREGKSVFLRRRTNEIAALLGAGIAVCLLDARNTGELASDHSRGRHSTATAHAATALMLGDPLIAQQLRDVRSVLTYLRGRDDVDGKRIALWGESFAELNDASANFRVPRRIDGRPHDVDPLGGTLALLTALYEDDIRAVYIHRGLADYQGALESPFVYIPLDSIIPGLLNYADLPDIAAALAPRPLQLSGMVDAYDRPLSTEQSAERHKITREVYEKADSGKALQFSAADASAAKWLIEQLRE